MTIEQRLNILIKELSATQEGKVNLDAPAWRTALKTIVQKIRRESTMSAIGASMTLRLIEDYSKAKPAMGAKGAYKARSASGSKRGKR